MNYIINLKLKQGDTSISIKSDKYNNIDEAKQLAEAIISKFSSTTDKTIKVSVEIEKD